MLFFPPNYNVSRPVFTLARCWVAAESRICVPFPSCWLATQYCCSTELLQASGMIKHSSSRPLGPVWTLEIGQGQYVYNVEYGPWLLQRPSSASALYTGALAAAICTAARIFSPPSGSQDGSDYAGCPLSPVEWGVGVSGARSQHCTRPFPLSLCSHQ